MNDPNLIDTHCHLEAADEICIPVIVPGIKLNDIQKLYNYRQINPKAKIGLGIHPWYLLEDINGIIDQFKVLINKYQPDFIGECGLDKLKPNFELQLKIFKLQLTIAQEFNLPIIIHCVHAYNELIYSLKNTQAVTGIIHGINVNSEISLKLSKLGFKLGIGRIILNPASQLVKSIKNYPLNSLVIESDAPYMPLPGNNKSLSSNCLIYTQELAKLLNYDLITITNILNQNIKELFKF